jgi:hypothetical protein
LKKEFTEESPHIKRKFQFICLPAGAFFDRFISSIQIDFSEFFSIYISSILEYLTTSQRLTQVTLSAWKLGMHAAVHDTSLMTRATPGLCTIRIERAIDSVCFSLVINITVSFSSISCFFFVSFLRTARPSRWRCVPMSPTRRGL